jgi:hypothetical protein
MIATQELVVPRSIPIIFPITIPPRYIYLAFGFYESLPVDFETTTMAGRINLS